MGMVYTIGMIALSTRVTGRTITLTAKASTNGAMDVDTMGTGRTILYMDRVRSSMRMAGLTKDSSKMI